MARKQSRKKILSRLPIGELERLIEEAFVDAHGESEQATGFLTMIENNIDLPFETEVLSIPVKVVRFDIDDRDQVVAICEGGGHEQTIQLSHLPLPAVPRPRGAEWIEAYHHWRRRWMA